MRYVDDASVRFSAETGHALRRALLAVWAADRAEHLLVAQPAHPTSGRCSGSKARLDFGPCMAYAPAKVTDEPLLFVGDDFIHTDITHAR